MEPTLVPGVATRYVIAGLVDAVLANSLLLSALVVLIAAASLLVVRYLDRPRGRWGARLRARLVLGVPWGTLLVSAFVLAVYLFVQDGITHWYDPVTLPFRSWSYLYPVGMLTAAFSHAGPGHLLGNLFGTVVLGSVAEYAWGHFPTERGSESFASWQTNPWIRALVVFPAVVIGVGLLTSLFGLGPVIGFSGVVFAFAGFGLVHRPITTIVAALGGTRAIGLAYRALRNPVVTVQPTPSPPTPPWWANIAVQAHGLGLLIGVLLAVLVVRARDERPSAARIWLAIALFAIEEALWAVYWFGGNETFILFRGPGLVLVAVLALLVAIAAAAPENVSIGSLDGRGIGMVVLLLVVAGLAGPAVMTNLLAVDAGTPPAHAVELGGYDVYYAENVENEMVSVVDVPGGVGSVKTSGVIVVSEQRHIWVQDVSKAKLAYLGRVTVDVGGIGWRETVVVRRQGWVATNGGTVYQVWIKPKGGEYDLAYTSDPARAGLVLAGKNVSIAAENGRFFVVVSRNGSVLGRSPIPDPGGSVTVGGIGFARVEGDLVAVVNETKVKVAHKEEYRRI